MTAIIIKTLYVVPSHPRVCLLPSGFTMASAWAPEGTAEPATSESEYIHAMNDGKI